MAGLSSKILRDAWIKVGSQLSAFKCWIFVIKRLPNRSEQRILWLKYVECDDLFEKCAPKMLPSKAVKIWFRERLRIKFAIYAVKRCIEKKIIVFYFY